MFVKHNFAFTFAIVLLIFGKLNSALSENNDCSTTQEALDRLGKIESILEALPQRLTQCTNQNRERWSGNQSTFGTFRRMPFSAKANLKFFRLENTADLEISTLIEMLRPCSNLETLQLEKVELIGTFPNTTSSKLLLPKLTDLRLVLSNYPDFGAQLVDRLIFIKKFDSQAVELEKIVDSDLNVYIHVGGWMKFAINHEFGELVLNTLASQDNKYRALLEYGIRSKVFSLKRLTLDSTRTISADLIPADLSYLKMNWVRFAENDDEQLPHYVDVIKKQTRLKELHIRTVTPYSRTPMGLNFEDLPRTILRLSVAQMAVNSTASHFTRLEEVIFDSAQFSETTILNFGRFFPVVERLAIIPGNLDFESYMQCHPILDKLMSSYTSRLQWIMMTRCTRKFLGEKPRGFERAEKILSDAGLPGDATNFVLEKIEEAWIGRQISSLEKREIVFKMSGVEKLRSWEMEMKL